jgi:small subunit ribosomal protein S16
MLVIRLRRTGRTKKPSFRVIVAEKTMPIYGRFVDIIGNVNLLSNPKVIEINKEKALDWMKKGAQPSETVARLMVKAGILKKEDLNWKPDKKAKKKKEDTKEEEKKPEVAPADKEEKSAEADAEKAPTEEPKEEIKDETAEVKKEPVDEVKEETPAEEKTE